jgi:acid phosphatase type 7
LSDANPGIFRFHYEHGPIHFIHYSTEHHFGKGSAQHAFVADALAAADRRRTPWVVFAGHRPIYIDSTNDAPHDGDTTVAADLQDAFEDLLKRYHVDVTLHGHHHSFQRTCPVFRDECVGLASDGVPRGPVHLVIGNAGAGLCLNVHKHKPKVRRTLLYCACAPRRLILLSSTICNGCIRGRLCA